METLVESFEFVHSAVEPLFWQWQNGGSEMVSAWFLIKT